MITSTTSAVESVWIGDLNRDQPTRAQLGALDELITYLRDRVGKIKGEESRCRPAQENQPEAH